MKLPQRSTHPCANLRSPLLSEKALCRSYCHKASFSCSGRRQRDLCSSKGRCFATSRSGGQRAWATHSSSYGSGSLRFWSKRNLHYCCRARKKRGSSSDDEDLESGVLEDETEDWQRRRGSRDAEEEEEEDLGDPAVSDPTTRLFQRVSSRDYGEEEVDEEEEEEDEDETFDRASSKDDLSMRGRKRKSQYERVNEGYGLPGVDDDVEDDERLTDDEDIGTLTEDESETDLDAIMGSAFEELPEDLNSQLDADGIKDMPSRAEQHRPSQFSEEDLEELDEDVEDDSLGPVMQYPDLPERRYRLGDLLEMCHYEMPESGIRDVEITGIQNRAAEVQEGDLYVCTLSGNYNGYLFIDAAIENGAVAVISEQELVSEEEEDLLDFPVILVDDSDEALRRLAKNFYNDASTKMHVVGISGSRGKTTTSWFVRGIFEEMQKVTGMIGSIENAISVDKLTEDGDLWEPREEDTTLKRECSAPFYMSPYNGKYVPPKGTPDSLRVQKLLAGMADRGATACVFEAETDALLSGQTLGVDVDAAVYMGLTEEDIEQYGDVEVLLNAQKRLFESLTDPVRQTAVVNMDDPYYEVILESAKAVPTVTFSSVTRDADVFVDKALFSMWETEVTITTPAGKIELSSTLIGRHNLPNLLAAVATGLALTIDGDGIPLKAIVQGIEANEIIPGRCEIIDEEQDFGVVIDAARTPESLSRLLDSIRETGPRRIILVFGCEGERDKSIRPFMGEIAHWKADIVILTNDNPRGERPSNIIADIVAGYPDDLLTHNATQVYSPGFLQDPAYIPFEALEFSWHNNFEYRRYVMEDRWTALRWAIGTAQKKDCVVIAGKGSEDFQELDLGTGLERGWFDDRVECRNALSKVAALDRYVGDIDRKELPWMEPEERMDNPRVFNVEADL